MERVEKPEKKLIPKIIAAERSTIFSYDRGFNAAVEAYDIYHSSYKKAVVEILRKLRIDEGHLVLGGRAAREAALESMVCNNLLDEAIKEIEAI